GQRKVYLQVFAPDGAARSAVVQVHGPDPDTPHHLWLRVSEDGAGHFLVSLFAQGPAGPMSMRARRFSSDGTPLGPEILINPLAQQDIGFGEASLRSDGSFLAVWEADDFKIRGRAYTADGIPQGPAFFVHTRQDTHHRPSVASSPRGWVVAWVDGIGESAPYARQFHLPQLPPPPCTGLCLNGGRFHAEVAWRVPRTGAEGTGIPIPLSADTGAFWFFQPSNYELAVKVLDGRGVNGHFWVFYGSLTDVEFDLTVTDTVTGLERTYHNPAGTMASRADTEAF